MGKNNNHKVLNIKTLNRYKSTSRHITLPTGGAETRSGSQTSPNLPNVRAKFSATGASKSKGMHSVRGRKGSIGGSSRTRTSGGQSSKSQGGGGQ